MQNLGMTVNVKYHPESLFYAKGVKFQTFHNVTEIHYNYAPGSESSIAFESDVHSTGQTHDIKDIMEYEAVTALSIADDF